VGVLEAIHSHRSPLHPLLDGGPGKYGVRGDGDLQPPLPCPFDDLRRRRPPGGQRAQLRKRLRIEALEDRLELLPRYAETGKERLGENLPIARPHAVTAIHHSGGDQKLFDEALGRLDLGHKFRKRPEIGRDERLHRIAEQRVVEIEQKGLQGG